MSYIRHIEGRFKEGKRDEAAKKVVDFYNGLVGKVKEYKGFIMTVLELLSRIIENKTELFCL
jgi:hypothetical protein